MHMNSQRRISPEQKNAFHSNGYVEFPGFFSADLVSILRSISDEMSCEASYILEASRAAGQELSEYANCRRHKLIVVPEASDPSKLCKYEFMIGSNPRFKEFVADYLQPTVSALVGEPTLPFKDKTNEKPPGGGAFRPHQDFTAYQFFKPRFHVNALLSIDTATVANGCVQFATNFAEIVNARPEFVMKSMNGRALLHHNDGGSYHGDIDAQIVEHFSWEPLETSPADLVLFDSFVPHFSHVNRTTSPRRAVFVTFNLASEGSWYDHYYTEKRVNYDDPKFHVSTPTKHRASKNAA